MAFTGIDLYIVHKLSTCQKPSSYLFCWSELMFPEFFIDKMRQYILKLLIGYRNDFSGCCLKARLISNA